MRLGRYVLVVQRVDKVEVEEGTNGVVSFFITFVK